MAIIRFIINLLKKLFKRLFRKKKVTKKIKKSVVNVKNKKYLKGYGAFVEETYNGILPLYLLIDESEKEKLLEKINLIETKAIDNNVLKELNKLSKKIENSRISFYQNEVIDEKLNSFLMDQEIKINQLEKVEILNKQIIEVLNDYDKNLKARVLKEYDQINYITVATVVLDESLVEIRKLEDECKHHRHNRYYYEREINKIKKRINNLKSLRDNAKIYDEIVRLREDINIKSKDKYDLLYNKEIFDNIDKICDDLLQKVNRRVVDLKKIKKEEKDKEEKKQERKKEEEYEKWQENIFKRFEDIELARRLLLLRSKKEFDIKDEKDLLNQINQIYFDFINGEKVEFNFERNKTKTELVQLYNDINAINSVITKREYVFIDHINYQMMDLINGVISQKEELDEFVEKKYNIKQEDNEKSVLVSNKLEILKEKEEERLNINSDVKRKVKVNDAA